MPSILLGLGKANKVKEFVLELDNYYDVQRPEKKNKVSKAVTFFMTIRLSDGLARMHNTMRWWQD
jgi:hypothetical protein